MYIYACTTQAPLVSLTHTHTHSRRANYGLSRAIHALSPIQAAAQVICNL